MTSDRRGPKEPGQFAEELRELSSDAGGLLPVLQERIARMTTQQDSTDDPVVRHWRLVRRRLIEALERMLTVSGVIVMVAHAKTRLRSASARSRSRWASVESSLLRTFAGASNVVAAAVFAAGALGANGWADGSIDVTRREITTIRGYRDSFPNIGPVELEKNTAVGARVVRPRERSQLSTALKLHDRGDATARIGRDDHRFYLGAAVEAWLAPASVDSDKTWFWVDCDPSSVARNTICAVATAAVEIIPPPPTLR